MLDYIRSFFSLIFAISFMYLLLDCKARLKQYRYLLGLYGVLFLICNWLVLSNFNYADLAKLYPLLVQFPVLFAFLFISRLKAIKVFFIHLTAIAITTSFILLGVVISSFLGSSNVIMNVVSIILNITTWLVFYRYLRPTIIYMLRNTEKGWYGFCIIPLSFCVFSYFTGKYSLDVTKYRPILPLIVLNFILMLAAYFLIFRFFKQAREQLTLQNEQNLLQMQVAAARMHLEELKESQEKTIIYRHDMRHHLKLINGYLEDRNMDAALKYIASVEENIESSVVEKYCSNYSVNLILYYYLSMAKKEEINVDTHIELSDENTATDMDLCVIFANAIENAINACKRITDKNQRNIKIVCKSKNTQLFIQIVNSYNGIVIFDGDMPVSEEENHGLGTKSIAAVVKKYSGVYSFTAQDKDFTVNIIL